jgi:Leucine-rich repeat (LRR) protein
MGQLAMLKYLSLSNCRRLKALPQLSQVERLVLSGCVKLGSLMGILGAGRYNLLDFCVEKCKSLGSLMGILSVEKSAPGRNELLELSLENCKSLVSLSEELSHFTKLTYLDLSSLEFRRIPTSIRELSFMRTLYLNNCNKIFSLTDLPESLKYLYAHGCESLEHVNFSSNHSFNHLDFSHCISLECISDLVRDFMNEEYSQEVRLSSL